MLRKLGCVSWFRPLFGLRHTLAIEDSNASPSPLAEGDTEASESMLSFGETDKLTGKLSELSSSGANA